MLANRRRKNQLPLLNSLNKGNTLANRRRKKNNCRCSVHLNANQGGCGLD
jgi:hypothetical protein